MAAGAMNKYSGLRKYLTARLVRILPALIFVVICCVLVGSIISSYSFFEYFKNAETYRYLLNGFMILQHNLPGVFEEAVYIPTVNGSLWTLPVEFLCNIMCYLVFQLGFFDEKKFVWTVPFVLSGTILLIRVGLKIPIIKEVLGPCLLFYIGIVYWIYRERIKYDIRYMGIAAVCLAACSLAGVLQIGLLIFFPYIMLSWWFKSRQLFCRISKLGDYSYTMYLWGFPVQQFIAERFNWNVSPYMNTFIAIPVCFMLAFFTYYCIEKPGKKLFQM